MRKILSVLLALCMIMTLAPAAAITSFAEEVLEIPTIGEVSEDELVEIYGEEEVELLAATMADFVPAEGDGVTYLTEIDGESFSLTGKAGEGSVLALGDGKYSTNVSGDNLGSGSTAAAADGNLWDAVGAPLGYMGYFNEAVATNNSVITLDLGAEYTFSGLRIYDSCRAKSLNNRFVKTLKISVSADGVLWYALDNATRTVFDTGNADFAFKKSSAAVNVEARFVKLEVTASANSTGGGGWAQYEMEEIVLLDENDANDTLTSEDFSATNLAGVTAKALVPAEGDGVTYLTELTGAVVTKTAGSVQGRLESVYNGIYTEGLKPGASTVPEFDVFPVVNGSIEGAMGWYTGDATNATTLRVDLGDVKTFSGIRLMDDHKARGMKARKATKLEVFVSEGGEKWGQLDDATTTRTTEVTPQYGDFKFALEGVAKNVEARYIEFRVTGVNNHDQFDIEEIVMLDADETLDTLTAEDYDPEIAEAKRDYYRQREWFTATSPAPLLNPNHPLSKLFDGIWHAPDHTGDDGAYWHTATGLTAEGRVIEITFTEAQKIGGFRFYPRVDNKNGNPFYVTVFASEDGTTFKEIKASTHIMDNTMAKPVELLVQTGVAYKALKIRVDKNAAGNANGHTCFCELQVLKPKKGYAYEEDVLYLETTPTVTGGSTQDAGIVANNGLFDGIVYQFANEAEGYYNPYIGTASSDPHFEMDNILKVAGDKAWMIVDLGKKYTFSGARLFGRWNQPGQSLTEGTLYVSDNGTDWTALDAHVDTYKGVSKTFDESLGVPANGCQMAKYASTNDAYTEMAVKVKGAAYNAKARYIKIEVTKTGGAHWSVQELLLVKADADKETKTVSELKKIATEETFEGYYTNAADWTWKAGSQYNPNHGVDKLYDGNVYGDMGACWHSAVNGDKSVTIMFDKDTEVGGVRVFPRTVNGGASANVIKMQGTYDGTTWVDILSDTTLGFTSDRKEEYKEAYLPQARNNTFKGIKFIVVKGIDGKSSYTNITELQVLKPVAPKVTFPEDEVEMGYPVGSAATYIVKAGAADTVKYDTTCGKIIMDGDYITYEEFVALGAPGNGVSTRQLHHDFCIEGQNGDSVYIKYDLGKVYEFSGVRLYQRAGGSQNLIEGFIYVSEDGENWVSSDALTGAKSVISSISEVRFGGTAYNMKARYIKIHCTKSQAGTPGHWGLEEVRLLNPAAGVETKTPTEITAALAAKAEAVETLINAIGTPVTMESKGAIKAARTAYDALSPAVKPSVDNYDVLVAAEAAYLALAGEALDGMVDELVISDLTAEDAEMVAELKEIYDSLSDEAKAEIDGAKLEKAAAVVAGLSKTIDPTVNGSGKLGYATLDYTLYTSGNDVTVTGVTYKGEAVTNANDEWKAVTNGDGTVTLTLGGNYYKSEAHRHWLYSSTLDSIKSHENGGNYYKFRTANADLGIKVGDEVTENTYNGFFVREITNNGPGKHVVEVSLSDGTTKEIVLNANYTWRAVNGSLAAADADGISPTGWQVTVNGGASLAHAAANWFNGNYGDATNSNSWTSTYYDETGAEQREQHFARAVGPYSTWVDFGKATKFAGVRLNDKNYNLTNVSLYGSNDLATWTKLGSVSGNNSKTVQVNLEDNAEYRYARIDIDEYQDMKQHSFLFLNEIVFLEASTRIIGGDIGVDLSEEIADVTRKFNSDNEYEITSVKVAGEEIAKDTDYVLDTTKAITFKAEFLGALAIGEYTASVSFSSGEVVETKIIVKDLSQADYYLAKASAVEGTNEVVLYNGSGLDVKDVSIVDGSSVEFTASGTSIVMKRTAFRRAINKIAFEKLPAEGSYALKVKVTFEDDSEKIYTVNIFSDWMKANGTVTTTFLADEVAVNAAWAMRTDSTNTPITEPFIKAAKNTQHLQNWHSYHVGGNGDAPSGTGVHYIDIDMGTAITEVGGIRYVSRANGADWGNVTIYASDDYATWTKLYEGKASGAAGAYTMKFTENAAYRYIRIKMADITHTTADTIHFLKPALAITGETTFKKDINANDEEIEIKLEDLGTATISKVTLGTVELSASDYVYDAEEDTILVKASGLNKITAEGDVLLAIETSTNKVGSVTVKYMDFSKKMFPQEVTPYHFDHEARIVSGIASGKIETITNRKVTTKSDGTALTNKDYEHTALKHDDTFMICSPAGTSANWNTAPGTYEIDYKIPHKFSAVRVYHRIWADGGVRQYFTTMTEGYIEVSNDGIHWLKSDLQTFGAGNLDSLDYNRNAYDDIKFIVDGKPMNVEARYVRVHATKNGAWQPLGIEEICLYEPSGSNAELAAAVITPNAPIYSLATMEDLVLDVEWNDYLTLDSICLKVEDKLVPVESGYYFCDETSLTISKYFFIDGGYDAGDEIALSIIGAVGSPIDITVTVADAEEYEINYEAGENGTLKAVVRSTDMTTGEEIEEEVASGSLVGRHEKLVFVAEGNEGYEAKEWTLTGKGADTVTYERVTDYKDWTFDAINAMEPVSKAFDKNDKTYWHSEYETKTTGSPNPTHLLSDGPYWITAIFDEPMMISEMSHTRRLNSDGSAYDAGQKVRKYKVWGSTDGGETFDVLLAEGDFVRADITDIIVLNDVGYIDGVKFEIYSTFASATKAQCSIGEITFTEKHITENHLSGGVTYTGSASQEFEIDSLFADATVTVEFAPVKKGVAIVETDLKRIEADVENSKVTFGEKAEITLTPAEGEELPEEITVIMEGLELKEGQDYTYDSTTGEVVVKNVKGDIKILAVAKGVEIYTVTYADENGATGKLPEAALYTEGDTFKLPKNTLKLTGSTFEGWKCSVNDKVYAAGTKFTMLAEDVTFTAVWEGKEKDDEDEGTKRPSVGGGSSSGSGGSFSGGAASVATVVTVNLVGYSEIKVNKGSIVADPAAKEGYDFMGWFLDAAFTVPYANNGVTENVTLYPYFRRVRNASELKDMQGHWAENTVGEMYVGYFINGTADGKFEPDKKITRAEFCQILYLMSGQTTDGAHNFTDVNVGDWFAGAVAWAVKSGITNGTTETTFAPYENITREQMATMIYRYATLMGHDWTITKEAGFADQAEVAEYANYQVNWAADKKIINGYPDGTFAPKSNATKAEAVTMLQRLLNLGK